MDIDQAITASKWLGVKTVIPMHYNTFPAINADANALKTKLAEENINTIILKKNESLTP